MEENKEKSLGINAVLNVIKSCLSIFFPLITYPYVFRILQVENIGKIDYVTSILSYFSFIALLGIPSYAIREGARIRNKRDKLNRFVNEVFSISVISTLISYGILAICLIFIDKLRPYSQLIILLSISIGFTTLGIDWVNTIYEDFLFITIRSIVTHIIAFMLLIVLVKNEEDYIIYALFPVITNMIICISNWIYCKKYITIRFTLKLNLSKHLKPIMALFANTIATSIYVNSDTILLGWLTSDYFVGIYGIAVKIYNVLKNILAALYVVAIPRLSFYLGQKDIVNFKKIYTKLVCHIILVLIPVSAGIISVAEEIILIMGGYDYKDAIITLQILAISLAGAICGGMVSYCLNIPLGREKKSIQATVISALINIVLNLFFIPIFKQNGAAVTTAISEIFVLAYCIYSFDSIKDYLDVKACLINFFHALLGVVSILLVAFVVHQFMLNSLFSLIIIGCTSVILYVCELLFFHNKIALDFMERILFRKK